MIGRTLCRLGVHRWEYEEVNETRRYSGRLTLVTVTRARCRRRCPAYHDWRMVNEERQRL